MSEIPEDVMKAADATVDAVATELVAHIKSGSDAPSNGIMAGHIARAIMAERERCARIVETYARDASFDDSAVGAVEHNANQQNIASAIRNP